MNFFVLCAITFSSISNASASCVEKIASARLKEKVPFLCLYRIKNFVTRDYWEQDACSDDIFERDRAMNLARAAKECTPSKSNKDYCPWADLKTPVQDPQISVRGDLEIEYLRARNELRFVTIFTRSIFADFDNPINEYQIAHILNRLDEAEIICDENYYFKRDHVISYIALYLALSGMPTPYADWKKGIDAYLDKYDEEAMMDAVTGEFRNDALKDFMVDGLKGLGITPHFKSVNSPLRFE